MTPFPHTPIRQQLEEQGRILSNDWNRYTCDQVLFRPAKMTVDQLSNMYQYAWDTFYAGCSVEVRMAQLYVRVIERERADGTYRRVAMKQRKRDRNPGTTP